MNKLGVIIMTLMFFPLSTSGQGASYADYSTREHSGSSFSLKTNTLYWLALTPNAEAEWYLGKRYSVNAETQFAWWSSNRKGFCYQLLSGGTELRYWFVEKERLHGHYMGVYGSAGMYDMMLKRTEDGFQGEFWSVGLTYGYAMPISGNLSLEFGIGVGYLNSGYSRYESCVDCFQRKSRERTHWIGPTKAKVALVWRIGKRGGR